MIKRFFRLCTGPLEGRILSPAAEDYSITAADSARSHFRLAVRAPRGATPAPVDGSAPSGEAVFIYEAFDRIDEISLEIVLCKYVETLARLEPNPN